jgi:hypothetical protein
LSREHLSLLILFLIFVAHHISTSFHPYRSSEQGTIEHPLHNPPVKRHSILLFGRMGSEFVSLFLPHPRRSRTRQKAFTFQFQRLFSPPVFGAFTPTDGASLRFHAADFYALVDLRAEDLAVIRARGRGSTSFLSDNSTTKVEVERRWRIRRMSPFPSHIAATMQFCNKPIEMSIVVPFALSSPLTQRAFKS